MGMTREEALNILHNASVYHPDYLDALNMAIEALEQEPTTKNDLGVELIDRAELLKAMDTWDKFGYTARYGLERLDKDDKDFVPYVKYDDMVNCVEGMPSVKPQEPKIGHWIMTSDYLTTAYGSVDYVKCSCCGEDSLEEGNYCPNCGAEMKSEVEE